VIAEGNSGASRIATAAAALRGALREHESMQRHCSWRAGGLARRFFVPADLDDLRLFLATRLPLEALYIIGLGSNLLVRDGGIDASVVLTHGALRGLKLAATDDLIDSASAAVVDAEAGVAAPKIARFAARHGLEGAEFLAGIPGTLGGALAMNAGCYGSETWRHVVDVTTVDRAGVLRVRKPGDYVIAYRQVELAGAAALPGFAPLPEWFVSARLRFTPGDGALASARIRELLLRRIASQPLQQPNAGSVFRNPPGDHAARLIEACGLKGRTIGGAQVSLRHANFIVNLGGADASDIEAMVMVVRDTVALHTGVLLEPEVRIIGEARA
jgi:UDP-N-acetylmuramate dehydrogenase